MLDACTTAYLLVYGSPPISHCILYSNAAATAVVLYSHSPPPWVDTSCRACVRTMDSQRSLLGNSSAWVAQQHHQCTNAPTAACTTSVHWERFKCLCVFFLITSTRSLCDPPRVGLHVRNREPCMYMYDTVYACTLHQYSLWICNDLFVKWIRIHIINSQRNAKQPQINHKIAYAMSIQAISLH